MGQSTDVVATQGRWLTCVEVKLKAWQRALQQCRTHCTVADFIYVAIALKEVPDKLIVEAAVLGYGILHVPRNGRCYVALEPRRNKLVWKPQRARFTKHLRAITYAS